MSLSEEQSAALRDRSCDASRASGWQDRADRSGLGRAGHCPSASVTSRTRGRGQRGLEAAGAGPLQPRGRRSPRSAGRDQLGRMRGVAGLDDEIDLARLDRERGEAADGRPRRYCRRPRRSGPRRARLPGASAMPTRSQISRLECARPRRIRTESSRRSMLPPHSTRPTRGRRSARDTPSAASPAAPAPSTTVFSISRSVRIASSIASSSTSRMSPTSASMIGKVSSPGALTAMPSAIVGRRRRGGRPAALAIDRRAGRCLDADDLDLRLDRLGRGRHARDQAAAADRHHEHVQVRHRPSISSAERALAGDDQRSS